MAPYIQLNDKDYVVSVTDEELLAGLFGGDPRKCRKVDDETAQFIKDCNDKAIPVHLSDLDKIEKRKN